MLIYRSQNFVVIRKGTSYIAINTDKPFDKGHTHLKGRKAAIDATTLVKFNKIPKTTDFYYLTSLQRLSTNEKYTEQIEQLKQTRKAKGKKAPYFNKNQPKGGKSRK